jgi:LacI family transcriptional regulator
MLDQRTNRKAPPTRRPRTPKVILLIESSRASGRDLLRGVASYSHHHGPWSFYWEPGGLEKAWPVLRTLDANGVILRDVEKLGEVLAQGIPAVVIEHSQQEVPGLLNVVTDSQAIGRMAAEHLLHCGFRHFAFCGVEERPWSRLRGEFFAARIREAGLEALFYEMPRLRQADSWRGERQSMATWLAGLPKPLGLMAANDDRGQQVIEACRIAGLQVPDEVAVIGSDNDEVVCGLSDPPLSSVAINFERAGYEAAAALDNLMRGRRRLPPRILAPATHVVARRSTDMLAIEDTAVARALRFIREHGRQNLSVSEVVRAAGVSRRLLEKRFRKSLGRPILKEIRRVRVGHIARLLVETDLPVARIADALGFADVQHVSRYFRAEQQASPVAFRRTQRG